MINININNKNISVPDEYTILKAASENGIHIPTLCHYHREETGYVNCEATCRVCVVEVEGKNNLPPACGTVVYDGMKINTTSRRAVLARRAVLELLLSNHPTDCLVCEKNRDCELQSLAAELNIKKIKYKGHRNLYEKDNSSYSIIRNPEKCIMCRRCETMCNQVQTVGVYSTVHRGFDAVMGTAFDSKMIDTPCVFCGQCISVCPTAALTETDNTTDVWEAIADSDIFTVAQTAPAVRAALGESFGMDYGTDVTGKMVSALRQIGFDMVLDTNFAADLTVVEEAKEFLYRLENGKLPMLTSCCPAWVKFVEDQFPDLLHVPSTCKSPHEMFGAVAKTYMAEKLKIDPQKIRVISIMPCIAKKFEAKREELSCKETKIPDVDYVLSTRELARMIKESAINFCELPDENFDDLMGKSSGAGDIFGTSGGVMEAVLRTINAWSGSAELDLSALRGKSVTENPVTEGIIKADIKIGEKTIRAAVSSGLGNARKLLESIQNGTHDFEILEIMACPNGCIGGGGQPIHRNEAKILSKRAEALYQIDKNKNLRMSHENPQIIKLYKDFLGEPYGEFAEKLLHINYKNSEFGIRNSEFD